MVKKRFSVMVFMLFLLTAGLVCYADNISEGKIATQSSTYEGCDAYRAVDGNTSGDFGKYSMSHTNFESNPWWQVDLITPSCITNIEIYNRTDSCMDRLTDYKISILDANKKVVWSINPLNYPNPFISFDVPKVLGRYVKIELNGTNYLHIAEVQVFGKEDLLYDKYTEQSSTYCMNGDAENAVDGSADGNWNNNSVSHTDNKQLNPWWKVNIGFANVEEIRIYNRTDACMERLSNYKVSITKADGTELWSTTQTSFPNPCTILKVPNVVGYYLKIELQGYQYLSLAEVVVLGEKTESFVHASQSSTFWEGDATEALDQIVDGNWNNHSVTHTNAETNPWWQGHLMRYCCITGIKIYNRTDACMERLSNFKVSILYNKKEVWSKQIKDYPNPDLFIDVPNITGDTVKIQLNAYECLSLAEVVCFGAQNAAAGKTAAQKSTYFGCDANRAIDGNTDGNWNNNSISHTNEKETNPWWQVDLETSNQINSIRIFNRTDACMDRLSNYKVTVYSWDLKEAWSMTVRNCPNPSTELFLPYRTCGRYVKVEVIGTDKCLSLAEVQVFGDFTRYIIFAR